MKRIVSGIQPTGQLHLGNYLGAIRNWVSLQQDFECFFMMVDLHALTTHPAPDALSRHTLEGAALYIAAGIDPEKSAIFPQSWVGAHPYLMWLLSCFTPLGWLNRMTQFKDKAGKNQSESVLGLYSYPVLMAADILLYQADLVPVGADQKQHVELTRDLALSINARYSKDVFKIPQPHIVGEGTRVMSLRDGLRKMSKSDPSEMSRISLFDDEESLRLKIQKARTDMDPFPTVYKDDLGRPEVQNLIQIYSALTDRMPQEICDQYGGGNFAPFKKDLADHVVATLSPIYHRFQDLCKNSDYVYDILQQGTERAQNLAHQTLRSIQSTLGLLVHPHER